MSTRLFWLGKSRHFRYTILLRHNKNYCKVMSALHRLIRLWVLINKLCYVLKELHGLFISLDIFSLLITLFELRFGGPSQGPNLVSLSLGMRAEITPGVRVLVSSSTALFPLPFTSTCVEECGSRSNSMCRCWCFDAVGFRQRLCERGWRLQLRSSLPFGGLGCLRRRSRNTRCRCLRGWGKGNRDRRRCVPVSGWILALDLVNCTKLLLNRSSTNRVVYVGVKQLSARAMM